MAYMITNIDNTNVPSGKVMVQAMVDSATMEDASTLPGEWGAGTVIYTAGYATVKQKGLDGTWTEVE